MVHTMMSFLNITTSVSHYPKHNGWYSWFPHAQHRHGRWFWSQVLLISITFTKHLISQLTITNKIMQRHTSYNYMFF
jgi:hypothetical protein